MWDLAGKTERNNNRVFRPWFQQRQIDESSKNASILSIKQLFKAKGPPACHSHRTSLQKPSPSEAPKFHGCLLVQSGVEWFQRGRGSSHQWRLSATRCPVLPWPGSFGSFRLDCTDYTDCTTHFAKGSFHVFSTVWMMPWCEVAHARKSKRQPKGQNDNLKPRSRLRTKHSGSDLIPWFNSWQHKQENLATNHTLQVIMKMMTWSWSHLSLPELSHIPCRGQIPDSKGGTYICHADQSSLTRSLAARFLAFRPQRPQVWKNISMGGMGCCNSPPWYVISSWDCMKWSYIPFILIHSNTPFQTSCQCCNPESTMEAWWRVGSNTEFSQVSRRSDEVQPAIAQSTLHMGSQKKSIRSISIHFHPFPPWLIWLIWLCRLSNHPSPAISTTMPCHAHCAWRRSAASMPPSKSWAPRWPSLSWRQLSLYVRNTCSMHVSG